MKGRWILKGIGFAVLGVALMLVVGYVVMWLWNWLMPDLFGLPLLTYWKAMGLLLLAKIFFGFGGDHGSKKCCCGNCKSSNRGKGKNGEWWREGMRKRWEGMSPEQREKYKHKMRKCWGDENCDDLPDDAMNEDADNSANAGAAH